MNKMQPSTIGGAVLFVVTALLQLLVTMGYVQEAFQPDILNVFNAAVALWAMLRNEKT